MKREVAEVEDDDDTVEMVADDEDLQHRSWTDIKSDAEEGQCVRLELCESFFLSWALGCLVVTAEDGSQLGLADMWRRFCQMEKDFVWRYTVYHHFRVKVHTSYK